MLSEMTGARGLVKTVPSTGGPTSGGTVGADGGSSGTGDANGMSDWISSIRDLHLVPTVMSLQG